MPRHPRPTAPTAAPPCRSLGAHCSGLGVVLRVSSLDDGPASGDHEATWLLGHTERLDFGELWRDGDELFVDAVLRVPCRYLETNPRDGRRARCRAHGFRGPLPRAPAASRPAVPRRLGEHEFVLVEQGEETERSLLPLAVQSPRSLPVITGANPCAGAPCRTADNRRGAACCRDLQIEIMCSRRQRRLEALVRSRRPPFLCKVDRESDNSLSGELISACGYLKDDGIECSLHGRRRPDGRPAKPDLCSQWPDGAEAMHPGCVFGNGGKAAGSDSSDRTPATAVT